MMKRRNEELNEWRMNEQKWAKIKRKWTNERMNKWTNEGTKECTDKGMDEYMNQGMNEETIKQIKSWTKNDQRLNEPVKKSVQIMNEELLNEPIQARMTELTNHETNERMKE